MRRKIIAGVLAGALAIQASAALAAPSLSGKWLAHASGQPIWLNFTAKGSTYTGTYTYTASRIVKNKVQYTQQPLPVSASVSVKNNVTRVVLTFTKTQLHVQCVLAKSVLSCLAPFSSAPVVFKHQAH